MAKGSVRKKGKKWYYRFYVVDEYGNRSQPEFPGTESKSETEALLRQAIADYEAKQFIAKAKNITVGDMLDMWVEEELKPGPLENSTVSAYIETVGRIKKHPIGNCKLKTLKPESLQSFMDLLSLGGTKPDGSEAKALKTGSILQYSAVLRGSFRFAVFPKRLITFNPMDYVVWRYKPDDCDLFVDDESEDDIEETPIISYEKFITLNEVLGAKNNPALLPIQIAYYAGLRIGEACGLAWPDINLKEQCLTVRRSMGYNSQRKRVVLGTVKRRRKRVVDFGDTLTEILRNAQKEQMKNSLEYGPLYYQNYYRIVKDKNRTYYEVYKAPRTEIIPEEFKPVSFVCLRPEGAFESPSTVSSVCRSVREKIEDDGFHFHELRHTYTSNLLSQGAPPQDVKELLGHKSVSTTLGVYAHSSRKEKKSSAKLLDKMAVAE